MANDIDKTSPHYKGEFGSIYEVNQKFPSGGVEGDYVAIDGWAHYWNADRGTWCVNAQRDSYWDELITGIINKLKLFKGATYMGVAGVSTVPEKIAGVKMYYFAKAAGTYSGFGGLQLTQGINVLYTDNGTSWTATPLLEVAQELGVSTEKVMSQKAVNTELGKKANTADVDTKFREEKKRVDFELDKKFDKESVVQDFGNSEDKVMSQKAVNEALAKKLDKECVVQDFGNSENLAMSQKAVTDWINKGYQFRGIAYPETNPGVPDVPMFYLAYYAGSYTGFGIELLNEIPEGGNTSTRLASYLALFINNGEGKTWRAYDTSRNYFTVIKNLQKEVKRLNTVQDAAFNLIPTQGIIPNIDTKNWTLNFGEDAVIITNNNRYVLKDVIVSLKLDYTTTSSTALVLCFNTELQEFEWVSWNNYVKFKNKPVAGTFRMSKSGDFLIPTINDTTSFNLNFEYTIDGVSRNTVTHDKLQDKIVTNNKAVLSMKKLILNQDFYEENIYQDDTRYIIAFPVSGESSIHIDVDDEFKKQGYDFAVGAGKYIQNNEILDSGWLINKTKSYTLDVSEEIVPSFLYHVKVLFKHQNKVLTEDDFNFIKEHTTIYGGRISGIDDTIYFGMLKQIRCNTGVKFMAHRGVHLYNIPENSLDAYRYAGYLGFDYVETDFGVTADNQLVLMHDDTINRTMANKLDYSDIVEEVKVTSKTLTELRENYVLKSLDERMRTAIPTAEEFFITCKHSGVFPIVEVKNGSDTQDNVRQAFEIGNRILGAKNFGFTSYSTAALDYARSLSDDLMLLYLHDDVFNGINSITGKSRETENTVWYNWYNGEPPTKETVEKYTAKGLKVAAWTVTPNEFDEVLKKGISIIATDYISPSLDKLNGITFDNNVDMSKFKTNGAVMEDKSISLLAGQTVTLRCPTNAFIGGYYVSVIAKGKFTISDLYKLNIQHNATDFERFIHQSMFPKPDGYFTMVDLTITAKENTVIKFIEVNVVQFV